MYRFHIFFLSSLLSIFFTPLTLCAQHKVATAHRCLLPPKIDGVLSDTCWNSCEAIYDFKQYDPNYNKDVSQKTVVKIAYDDDAIYVSAMMYDTAPDSILRQLGNRDDELNADYIGVEFDTYGLQQDAYVFMVYASGVQKDYRYNDGTYNGVWQSVVKLLPNGWACEMKISYSAIRFPTSNTQKWGFQLERYIRRNREIDQWMLEIKGSGNTLADWGKLEGVHEINSPLRLSLSPFLSVNGSYYPYNVNEKSNFSSSFSGGLDLKYGINESFTLDVTLLPDFSQVQSDYQVKNISAFETVYEDYRPFFTEAIDLFKEGNLFYSRRIGREPTGYYAAYDSLRSGEVMDKNPATAKLINAIKFSGRNKHGTAIGIFNAITNNMYATVKDSLGNKRKILTEPLTNYNIFVFDQVLKHNSKIYFVNTSTIRTKKKDDSNISLLGIRLNDKKNNYQFAGHIAVSQLYHRYDSLKTNFQTSFGYRYGIAFNKLSGALQFSIYRDEMNQTWDANDLGLVLTNNQTATGVNLNYYIFKPFGKFKDMASSFAIAYTENYLTKYVENFTISLSNNFTTKKYHTIWSGLDMQPIKVNDFYEPRIPGRFYMVDEYYYIYAGSSSDYRKAFALDCSADFYRKFYQNAYYYGFSIKPIVRISNHFNFNLTTTISHDDNAIGFADFDNLSNILFGKRDVNTVENKLNLRYIFKNNLSLSLTVRHYWSDGVYSELYNLNNDGVPVVNTLISDLSPYNFNYNAFNIDLLFFWEFAPGSSLNIAYKNNISDNKDRVINSYFRNFGDVFAQKQLNSLSIKVLYYIDYQNIKTLAHKNKTKTHLK